MLNTFSKVFIIRLIVLLGFLILFLPFGYDCTTAQLVSGGCESQIFPKSYYEIELESFFYLLKESKFSYLQMIGFLIGSIIPISMVVQLWSVFLMKKKMIVITSILIIIVLILFLIFNFYAIPLGVIVLLIQQLFLFYYFGFGVNGNE